jgi:hypothetical protein
MPQRSGTSPAVLAIIVAAIAAGAGASLLAVATPVFVPTATPLSYVTLSPLVFAIILLAPVVVGALGMLLGKVVSSEAPLRRQLGAMGAVAMLLAAAFLLILGHLGGAPGLFGSATGGGGGGGGGGVLNGSGGPPSGGGGGTGNGSSINSTNSSGSGSGSGNSSGNQTENSTNGTSNTTQGNPPGGNGTTNHTGPGPNGTRAPKNTTGSSRTNPLNLWGLPGWAPLVAVALIGFAAAAFIVPALSRRRARPILPAAPLPPPNPVMLLAETQAALAAAADRLDKTNDPRAVIVELYGRLLGEVTPYSGSLDARTPEEIRSGHLLRLGVRREAADELTRLFEEARYSSHPLDSPTIRRALAAIRTAETDLGGHEAPRR